MAQGGIFRDRCYLMKGGGVCAKEGEVIIAICC